MNQEKNEKNLLDHEISLPIAEIRRRLAPMNLSAVALGAGVHVDSVYRLAHGEGEPLSSTLLKVSRFLRRHAAGEDVAVKE
jgi:DNA-binding phage protein